MPQGYNVYSFHEKWSINNRLVVVYANYDGIQFYKNIFETVDHKSFVAFVFVFFAIARNTLCV